MIEMPKSTLVHKRLPKEAFYRNLTLDKRVKDRFVSEIDTIYLENSLTKERLHLTADSPVQEILLLTVHLKQQDCSAGILEAIARQNPHKLVFLLCYEDQRQLALYYGKLYRTAWVPEERLTLEVRGFSLTEVWEGFVEQVALPPEQIGRHPELTLQERISRAERIVKLEREIKSLETKVRREKQFNKQVEMNKRLKEMKDHLRLASELHEKG